MLLRTYSRRVQIVTVAAFEPLSLLHGCVRFHVLLSLATRDKSHGA